MKVNLTHATVKAMAARMVKKHGGTLPTALEHLATAFGHRNWDELSGVLKKEENTVVSVPMCFDLYMPMYACDEYGESPVWAKVVVNTELVTKILATAKKCADLGATLISVDDSPADYSNKDSLRVQYWSLEVSEDTFWFKGYPKHCDYAVETVPYANKDLLALAQQTSPVDNTLKLEAAYYLNTDYSATGESLFDLVYDYVDPEAVVEWVAQRHDVNFDSLNDAEKKKWIEHYARHAQ